MDFEDELGQPLIVVLAFAAFLLGSIDTTWTAQRARSLAIEIGTRLEDMRFLIRDRSGNFTAGFDAVFQDCGLQILHSPPQAPRANAICERLIGTLRREALDHILVLGQAHLRRSGRIHRP